MNYGAYDAGYDAYWEGVEINYSPYDPEEAADAFQSWQEGWRKARAHDYDESDG